MRGSPLFQALIAFAAILLAGWPLWRLTHESAVAQSVPAAAPAAEAKAIHLQLDFTAAPSSVSVLHLGQEVWSASDPGSSAECDLHLPFPKEGIELQFNIAWPSDALCALRARLTDPDGREHERSVWGRGEVSEVAAFGSAE